MKRITILTYILFCSCAEFRHHSLFFDVSHLSANNTLKVIQDMEINNNNDKTVIFHECVEKNEVCLFFSKPFDSFNKVFNISIPLEVFHIV